MILPVDILVSILVGHVQVGSRHVDEILQDNILVRWSTMLIDVSILSKIIRSRSTQSQREKYLMSMWRVHVVGFWALPMAVQPSLSSYVTVAASWGMLRSQRMLWTKRHILPMSTVAMNLAFVNERATVGWNLVLYAISTRQLDTDPA